MTGNSMSTKIIDIDDLTIEMEYQITRNLLDYYEKMVYSEYYYDAQSVIVEADGSSQNQGLLLKIWNGIKKIFNIILNVIRKTVAAIKKHFSSVAKVDRALKSASPEDLEAIKKIFEEYNNNVDNQSVTTEGALSNVIAVGKQVAPMVKLGNKAAKSVVNAAQTVGVNKSATSAGSAALNAAANMGKGLINGNVAAAAATGFINSKLADVATAGALEVIKSVAGVTVATTAVGGAVVALAPTVSLLIINKLISPVLSDQYNATKFAKDEKRKRGTELPTMDQLLNAGQWLSKNMTVVNKQIMNLSDIRSSHEAGVTAFLSDDVRRTMNHFTNIKNGISNKIHLSNNEGTMLIIIQRTLWFNEELQKVNNTLSRIQANNANQFRIAANNILENDNNGKLFTDAYTVFTSIQGNELNSMLSDLDEQIKLFNHVVNDNPTIEKLVTMATNELAYSDESKLNYKQTMQARKDRKAQAKANNDELKDQGVNTIQINIKNDIIPLKAFADTTSNFVFAIKNSFTATLNIVAALGKTSRQILNWINHSDIRKETAKSNVRANNDDESSTFMGRMSNRYIQGKGRTRYMPTDRISSNDASNYMYDTKTINAVSDPIPTGDNDPLPPS